MTRGQPRIGTLRDRIALGLVVLALLVRLLVPAGWMPAASNGYAITLCTGVGAVSAWVDEEGKLHKSKPGQAAPEGQCLFAGLAAAFEPSTSGGALIAPPPAGVTLAAAMAAVAIGRGLAAPPPPPTGPPATR